MVSLRRRRLLGLRTGISSVPVQLPESTENGSTMENTDERGSTVENTGEHGSIAENTDEHGSTVANTDEDAKPLSVHPLPGSHQEPITNSEASPASANVSASTLSKEETGDYYPGKEVKRRKRHRRNNDQEPSIMRGVYFKNMKWQAAIKVDKKQIHLGTVESQEEAARLYDRAAFMCGREPNSELSEEEKQELSQYRWEEFLELTRNAISSKKHQRRIGVGGRTNKTESQYGSDCDPETGTGTGGSSISGDEEEDDQGDDLPRDCSE